MHDCVGVIIGGVQHTDGPLQVKYWGGGPDACDPCGVDAYGRRLRSGYTGDRWVMGVTLLFDTYTD